MTKTKVLLAMGIILLFIGLSFSPATAKVIKTDLTEKLNDMEGIIPKLMDEMSQATSISHLLEILTTFTKGYGNRPIIGLIMTIIKEIMNVMNRINGLRPLKTNAFIMSWGFANKINPFKDNKFQLYRPFTAWCYSGKSNLIVNSRTIIIDFQPFSIKMLTGRQIGFMRNFAGIYSHRETTLTQKSHTFFMGKTAAIRGFDLSILNILGQ
jgi:hypothetical protein